MGRYYQKYFEDYEEDRVSNKRGNGTHLQYTYKGFYYRQELTPVMQALLRVCYVVLFGLELYFFAKAGTKGLYCNLNPAIALLQAFSMLGYVWLGWILFFYVSAPRDMTIYKYKSTALQLQKAQMLSVALSLTKLLVAVGITVAYNGFSSNLVKDLQEYILVAVLGILWLYTEKSMRYKKIYNSQKGM